MKPESLFKQKVKARFNRLIHDCEAYRIEQQAIRGTPDFLVCFRGWFVAVECKASEKEIASPLQSYNLARITKVGGVSFICNPQNIEEVFEQIKKLPWRNVNDSTEVSRPKQ